MPSVVALEGRRRTTMVTSTLSFGSGAPILRAPATGLRSLPATAIRLAGIGGVLLHGAWCINRWPNYTGNGTRNRRLCDLRAQHVRNHTLPFPFSRNVRKRWLRLG